MLWHRVQWIGFRRTHGTVVGVGGRWGLLSGYGKADDRTRREKVYV
jgi:hypothetical protein